MTRWARASRVALLVAITLGQGACATSRPAVSATPAAGHCDAKQTKISDDADNRSRQLTRTGVDFRRHLETRFPDHKVAWIMREDLFQKFVVQTNATKFGRCEAGVCYLFVAPLATIKKAVADAMKDGKHDPVALGKALGLPAASFEGPLRMMTLDLDATPVCARLPVDDDPGAWKCKTPVDTDCFHFGGYTSGGIAEAMIIDAPVAGTLQENVP